MRVSSVAGTDLRIDLQGAVGGGNWGYTSRPGTLTHWPGGLVLAFPAAGSVNGTLVLAEGDVNLTFKRYIDKAVTLTIEDDYVTRIDGTGVDADLLRSHFEAWGEREAYAVSHVGWGLNAAARWDSMAFYDKRDFNGTELRAFAGNFLYSTGANETAGRYTRGHFDWPMRHCTRRTRRLGRRRRGKGGRLNSLPTFTTLGNGPTVLMLHGIGGGHLAFAPRWKRWPRWATALWPGTCRATDAVRPSSPTPSKDSRRRA